MIFITGDTRAKEFVAILQQHGWGRMVIDQKIQSYNGEPWAFDNGAYRDYLAGEPFNQWQFLRRLSMAESLGRPYLAIVPDKVGAGRDSLDISNHWRVRPELDNGWPWYLAVQDGMSVHDVEDSLTSFAYNGLFLGGSTLFKRTARTWSELAHKYGTKFHYGRAGTPMKIRHAATVGADSCDSAFPLWHRDRLATVIRSLEIPSTTLEAFAMPARGDA
jgi:hypothetical protein